jgi:hypothetical protein
MTKQSPHPTLSQVAQESGAGTPTVPRVLHGGKLDRAALPVVAFDRPVTNSSIVSVVCDNFPDALTATQHVIDHVNERIICRTDESSLYTIRERMQGCRMAVEAAHLARIFDASVRDCPSAEYALRSLLDGPNPPDAIFTTKIRTTICAFETLQKLPAKRRTSLPACSRFAQPVSLQTRLNRRNSCDCTTN